MNFIHIHTEFELIYLNQPAKETTQNILEKKRSKSHTQISRSPIKYSPPKIFIPVLIHLRVINDCDKSILERHRRCWLKDATPLNCFLTSQTPRGATAAKHDFNDTDSPSTLTSPCQRKFNHDISPNLIQKFLRRVQQQHQLHCQNFLQHCKFPCYIIQSE